MRTYSKIVLTAWLHSGPIQGQPGLEVEVSDDNREAVVQLVKDRGCRVVWDPPEKVGAIAAAPTPEGSEADDEAEGDGLSALEDSDSVDALEVPPRYIQALKDAGLNTVGAVRTAGDLSAIPSITAAAAKKIAAELE
jgi:hypothetical protein